MAKKKSNDLVSRIEKTNSAYQLYTMKEEILSSVSKELKTKLQGIESMVDFFAYKNIILKDLRGE